MSTLKAGLIGALAMVVMMPTLARAQGTVTLSATRGWTEPALMFPLDVIADLSGFKPGMTYTADFQVTAKKPDASPFTIWGGGKTGRIGADGKSTATLLAADVSTPFGAFKYGSSGPRPSSKAAAIQDFRAQDFDVSVKVTFSDGSVKNATGTVVK